MPWQHGPRICNGHKRDGSPCGQPAIRDKTKCRLHGGRTPSGMAHGAYKHGRYSKVLPVRLAQRYNEARTHPTLLSLRDDIAVSESRLADLFSRVDTGESGARWQALRESLDAFSTAMAVGDVATMHRHFATMRQLVTQGSDDAAAWADIQRLWETRCRLTMTEQKTLIATQQMVTVEQLMTYFGVITDAINRIVPARADPDAARAILGDLSAEFNRISNIESILN